MGAVKPTRQNDGDPLDRCVVTECTDATAWAKAQESAAATEHRQSLPVDGAHPNGPQSAGITVIDSGRLTESMSENGLPIGSPARDLAAFTHKLGTFGVRYHLGEAEISELSKLFNRSYAAAGPATTPEAMQFFRARVALGAFLDALKRPASSPADLKEQLRLFKEALDLP